MTQIIEVPGMGEVEFPDDMSDDQISAAIKSSLPQQMAAPQQEKALGPWASAAVRPLAKGAAALPLMAMDAGVAARNLAESGTRKYLPKVAQMIDRTTGGGPGQPYELPSSMFNRALDTYTTKPEGVGAAAEGVSSALVGAAVPSPQVALQAPAGFVRPAASAKEEFVNRGIPLTMGQRGGKVIKAAEDFASNVPLVGGAIKARQQEALEAWNRSVLQKIDANITKGGKEGFEQAGQTLSRAYKSIWKEELPYNRTGLRDQWTALAGDLGKKLPKEQADEVTETLRRHFQQVLSGARANGTQGAALESVDDALREAAKKASRAGDGAVAGAYNSSPPVNPDSDLRNMLLSKRVISFGMTPVKYQWPTVQLPYFNTNTEAVATIPMAVDPNGQNFTYLPRPRIPKRGILFRPGDELQLNVAITTSNFSAINMDENDLGLQYYTGNFRCLMSEG